MSTDTRSASCRTLASLPRPKSKPEILNEQLDALIAKHAENPDVIKDLTALRKELNASRGAKDYVRYAVSALRLATLLKLLHDIWPD